MSVSKVIYACDWCEATETFEGEGAEQAITESAWFVVERSGKEWTFCCTDCMFAYL